MIDLKDCLFTIPIQEQDKEKFAFTVSAYNNSKSVERYQWKIPAKRMLNTNKLCQYFVQQPVEIICKLFHQSIIYHYVDDILVSNSNVDNLERMFEK